LTSKGRDREWIRAGNSGSQVEPLIFTVFHEGQADPAKYAPFFAIQIKNQFGRCTVDEINPSLPAVAAQHETPHSLAGKTCQPVFATPQRETKELEQLFFSAMEMPAQAKQFLSICTESIQSDGHGTTVRPEKPIAFKTDLISLPVTGRVSTKENSQGTCHLAGASKEHRRADLKKTPNSPICEVISTQEIKPKGAAAPRVPVTVSRSIHKCDNSLN
jgi:hypothetical protein